MITCTCPKCNAPIELDLVSIPANGSFEKCSSCQASLEIRKESFAQRSLYKSTEISCAECGNPPGPSIYCEDCHAIFPEIIIIETSSAAKKLWKKLNSKSSKASTAAESHAHFTPAPSLGKSKGKGVKVGSPVQLALILILILGAVAAGGYFWYQDKIATEYSENYVRAVMGMKTARDFEINTGNNLVNSMRAGGVATLAEKDLKLLTSSRKDVDTLMKRVGKPPEKFTASNDALNKLHENFGKLHAAITAPAGTVDIYADTIKKMDDEFMLSAKTLKSGLKDKVAETFNASAKKYKALQNF